MCLIFKTLNLTVIIDQSFPMSCGSNYFLMFLLFQVSVYPLSCTVSSHRIFKERLLTVVGDCGTFCKGFS